MKFGVYGGFQVTSDGPNAQFWDSVEDADSCLSGACGCYIFAINNGGNIKPWYVGKTERRTFRTRISFQDNRQRLHDLSRRNGTLQVFLLPALTENNGFRAPRKSASISHLETMLISMALKKNRALLNIQIVQRLQNMKVPGVINPGRGRLSESAEGLRNALGL